MAENYQISKRTLLILRILIGKPQKATIVDLRSLADRKSSGVSNLTKSSPFTLGTAEKKISSIPILQGSVNQQNKGIFQYGQTEISLALPGYQHCGGNPAGQTE